MGPYFLAFGWGFVILISWIGWGGILNRILFPENETDWGQKAAWGVAFSVVVGGVLNLFTCISRAVVLAYLALGVAAWLGNALSRRARAQETAPGSAPDARGSRTLRAGGFFLLGVLALIFYAGSVSVARYDYPSSPAGAVRFNQADDFQAYIIFPEKMLQLGAMGPDPFCTRRLVSSLGGQWFLDTFVLSLFSVEHLHIVDPGLGLLMILGLLGGAFKEKGVSAGWALAWLLVVVWLDPPTVNIASLYTGTALFLSLGRTLDWKALAGSRFVSRAAIMALLAAAICMLKSNFILACAVLLACSYVCYVISQNFRREAIAETAVTAVMTIAFILPGMISLYKSSGTLLYPLLGKGTDQSVYKDSLCAYCWLTPATGLRLVLKHLVDVPSLALIALGIFYLASRRRGIRGREPALALLLAAILGHIAVTLATAESYSRYSFAFLLAAILMLAAEILSPPEKPGERKLAAAAPMVAVGVAAFLVGTTWHPSKILYAECLRSAQAGLSHASLVSGEEIEAYKALQQSIPPGQAVLEKLDKPFLLDFKRNKVFVLDWAASSPPPGLPFSKGSEALARYLTSLPIPYVAYSYGGEAERRKLPTYFPWFKIQLLYSYDFEDNVEGLGRTRKHVYDDDNSFVLDLSQPIAPAAGR